MSDHKIISLAKYKKSQQKNHKMFFIVIVVAAFLGALSWNYFVENVGSLDVQIPESKNLIFNEETPIAMTTAQVANEFEHADGKPILLYIYATWCKICTKNFATFNEIAREFQNTELQVISLAIDRDITPQQLSTHLNLFGKIYFQPRFLTFKEGFLEFLQKKNIHYNNRVPFTVLISRDGEVIVKYSGAKNKNYLRNKIIKELF